jgi:hypothetical protein
MMLLTHAHDKKFIAMKMERVVNSVDCFKMNQVKFRKSKNETNHKFHQRRLTQRSRLFSL